MPTDETDTKNCVVLGYGQTDVDENSGKIWAFS